MKQVWINPQHKDSLPVGELIEWLGIEVNEIHPIKHYNNWLNCIPVN